MAKRKTEFYDDSKSSDLNDMELDAETLEILNNDIIKSIESVKRKVIADYVTNRTKTKLMEFLNSGFGILKWLGFKAFFLPHNIFGMDETTYRLVGAISQMVGIIGEGLTDKWIEKHDVSKESVDMTIEQLDRILNERYGEQIFPELKQNPKNAQELLDNFYNDYLNAMQGVMGNNVIAVDEDDEEIEK